MWRYFNHFVCKSLLAAALFLFGCESANDPYVEVGTGEREFEPVNAGDRIPLIRGSQGLVHVWLSFCVFGLDASERMEFKIETRTLDESQPSQVSRVLFKFKEFGDDCAAGIMGWPAVISNPACFAEKEVEISVRVEDFKGEVAQGEMIIVPYFTEASEPCDVSE